MKKMRNEYSLVPTEISYFIFPIFFFSLMYVVKSAFFSPDKILSSECYLILHLSNIHLRHKIANERRFVVQYIMYKNIELPRKKWEKFHLIKKKILQKSSGDSGDTISKSKLLNLYLYIVTQLHQNYPQTPARTKSHFSVVGLVFFGPCPRELPRLHCGFGTTVVLLFVF